MCGDDDVCRKQRMDAIWVWGKAGDLDMETNRYYSKK